MAKQPVTARDVAARAGVASGTVSRVLNNHANVGPELRTRVLAAARELGYDAMDRAQRTRLEEIGFFLTLDYLAHGKEPMDPFWAGILHGAEAETALHGIRVTYRSLAFAGQGPDAIADELLRMGVGAGLLVGTPNHALIDAFARAQLPAVLIDHAQDGAQQQSDAVVSDNFGGARSVVEHLIAAGHRRIAFVGGPLAHGNSHVNAIYSIEWRAIGYRAALYRAGIAHDPELEVSCRLNPEAAYEATLRLLARTRDFTAIFCANDPTASGVLRALHESGIDVPGEVSAVGFDDIIAAHLYPTLTTVHVDTQAMGTAAVRTLMQRIDHPDGPPTTVVLPVRLVPRNSVAVAPAQGQPDPRRPHRAADGTD